MRLLEMEQLVKEGRLTVDGKIVLNDVGELAVTKGTLFVRCVAKRF
jgi:hypothetical protein